MNKSQEECAKYDLRFIGKLNPRHTFQCPICFKFLNGLSMTMITVDEKDCAHGEDVEISQDIYKEHITDLKANGFLSNTPTWEEKIAEILKDCHPAQYGMVVKIIHRIEQEAYTKGRADEAKTCEGCKKDKEKLIQEARADERGKVVEFIRNWWTKECEETGGEIGQLDFDDMLDEVLNPRTGSKSEGVD